MEDKEFYNTPFGQIWQDIMNNPAYQVPNYQKETKFLKFNKNGLIGHIEIKDDVITLVSFESEDLNFIFENKNNNLSLRTVINALNKLFEDYV